MQVQRSMEYRLKLSTKISYKNKRKLAYAESEKYSSVHVTYTGVSPFWTLVFFDRPCLLVSLAPETVLLLLFKFSSTDAFLAEHKG
jgi:hypothetical protein